MSPRQKALAIFALVSMIVLSAALACAQPQHPMNPKTQIAWPGNCAGSVSVYNIVTNSCQANGTAANPAGSPGQGQFNFGGAFAGTSHVTYDANGFPTLLGNVNTQFNVMAYGAKGDCTTDDHDAIQAAITAAGATTPEAVVYFPTPSACYLTSTLTWNAASLEGQPTGAGDSGLNNKPVVLKGKPGQDILHVTDPTVGAYTWQKMWSIRNIGFMVDNTSAGSFSHRWPGRWFDDVSVTNGSATMTTAHGLIDCSDVGVGILIKGAGAAGADLTTTISSLPSCADQPSTQTATLAATASTTLTNATAYISLPGISTTTNVGACAIAFDNYNGSTASWTQPSNKVGNLNDAMANIGITSVTGSASNNTCGIYTQGAWGFYGLDAQNININRVVYGIVQGSSELNSYSQSSANDLQSWDHGNFNNVTFPWISYNGGYGRFTNFEFTTSNGPFWKQLGNQFADASNNWVIQIPEFENATGIGLILAGGSHTLTSSAIGSTSRPSYIEGHNITALNSSLGSTSTLYVDGSHNRIEIGNQIDSITVNDRGRGNVVVGSYYANPLKSKQPSRFFALNRTSDALSGRITPDFLRYGLGNDPFFNELDLFFGPQTLLWTGQPSVVVDATSFTGFYLPVTSFTVTSNINNFKGATPIISSSTSGGPISSTQYIVYLSAKCPSGTTYTAWVQAGGVNLPASSLSCTTTYTTQSFVVDLTAHGGESFNLGWSPPGGSELDIAWEAIWPYTLAIDNIAIPTTPGAQFVTGPASSTNNAVPVFSGTAGQLADSTKPLAGSGPGVTTGPASGTTAGHMATFQGTTGQIQDGGAVPAVPLAATTAALGGSALTAGQCVTAAIGVSGATTSMVATASPSSDPGTGFTWDAWVSSANNATVRVCAAAAGTPASVTYNVRVIQ